MVDQIKALCAAHNTNIKSLEKELGFGNGTIRRWDERKPSYDRIESVARRFGVPVSYLTGEGQKEKPVPDGTRLNPKYYDLSDENRLLIDEMISKLLKSQSED